MIIPYSQILKTTNSTLLSINQFCLQCKTFYFWQPYVSLSAISVSSFHCSGLAQINWNCISINPSNTSQSTLPSKMLERPEDGSSCSFQDPHKSLHNLQKISLNKMQFQVLRQKNYLNKCLLLWWFSIMLIPYFHGLHIVFGKNIQWHQKSVIP